VAALYAASELERLRVYEVMDRLVELWLAGGLALGPGDASARLDAYWLESNVRIGARERRDLYASLFGDGNRAFADLWAKLLAPLAAGSDGAAVALAARDLRANLFEHAGQTALAAAPVLRDQLGGALEIMSHPDIRAAYGAQNVWQLIEHLIRREGGEPPDIARVQTTAASGASVLAWLASGDLQLHDEVVDAASSWLAAQGPI